MIVCLKNHFLISLLRKLTVTGTGVLLAVEAFDCLTKYTVVPPTLINTIFFIHLLKIDF